MLRTLLAGPRLQQYLTSPYKSRLDRVGHALRQHGYLPSVIGQQLREWLRVTQHFDTRGVPLPDDFRDPLLQAYLATRTTGIVDSRARCIRAAIRILVETDEQGHFRRRIPAAPERIPVPWFEAALAEYLVFLREHRQVRDKTLHVRTLHLQHFASFLDRLGVTALTDMRVERIRECCLQLHGRKPATRQTYACTLRSFLRWAYVTERVPQDLSPAPLTARKFRQVGLPDILSEAEVERLLAATDRHTAIGRRDLAVLLLACRYGMRASDIRQLSLEHLDWRRERLRFPQSKTGRMLELPLLPEVAAALAAYLRDGRPTTTARQIFVRHRAPYAPLGPNNNFCTLMRQALERAGLGQRPGRRGLYLLRHTLATRLLGHGQPLKTIGDILGHATTDVTRGYAKVELIGLRTVAIAETEVRP